MKAYPCGNYPVFEGYDHMQYQIRDPKGFAEMLTYIAEHDSMPKLPESISGAGRILSDSEPQKQKGWLCIAAQK